VSVVFETIYALGGGIGLASSSRIQRDMDSKTIITSKCDGCCRQDPLAALKANSDRSRWTSVRIHRPQRTKHGQAEADCGARRGQAKCQHANAPPRLAPLHTWFVFHPPISAEAALIARPFHSPIGDAPFADERMKNVLQIHRPACLDFAMKRKFQWFFAPKRS
jgi:hypothetical protein